MGGVFVEGEKKVRPGAYFRITTDDVRAAERVQGIVAVLLRADFGPLKTPAELKRAEEVRQLYGKGQTADAAEQAFAGGARQVLTVRVGNGGTKASVSLNDAESSSAVTVTARYPGTRAFTITVRDAAEQEGIREAIIYEGTEVFETFTFAKGGNESKAFSEAVKEKSRYFDAALVVDEKVLKDVTQEEFTAGTNPEANTSDYAEALEALELYDFDVLCVDTEDTAVQHLAAAYLERIYDTGILAMGVFAEKSSQPLAARMEHAAAFNSEKLIYVVNPAVKENAGPLDGYQTAARIAGMVAVGESNTSLTHTVLEGITELADRLSPAQMEQAEQSGCLVLSYNSGKQVWIDSAINTLTQPGEKQDDGWKKIRRTKTRYELIRRMNAVVENLIGKVDNDTNGRAALIAQLQDIGTAMIEEGKLNACTVSENTASAADGDTAYFDIDVVDKDSMEHVYLVYRFQFSTNV